MSKPDPKEDINIVRDEHGASKAYFLMSRATAQDETLTFAAIGTLAYLLSKPDGWVVRNKDLEKFGTQAQIKRIIKELTTYGYLTKPERIRDPETKKFTGWTPRKVYETPIKTVSLKPDLRKTERSDSERSENNPLDITERDITERENTEKGKTLPEKNPGDEKPLQNQKADGYTEDHLQRAIVFEWARLKLLGIKTGCTPKVGHNWEGMFYDNERLKVYTKAIAISKEELSDLTPQSERDGIAEAMVDEPLTQEKADAIIDGAMKGIIDIQEKALQGLSTVERVQAKMGLSSQDIEAEQASIEKPNKENDAMKLQAKAFNDSMFDEIANALGHIQESLKSKAVKRIVGQTRKALLSEGFVLGDAKQYIEQLRAYYRKQEWTITDEIYKTDKNLSLWAKAKATHAQLADVNGINVAQSKIDIDATIAQVNKHNSEATQPLEHDAPIRYEDES